MSNQLEMSVVTQPATENLSTVTPKKEVWTDEEFMMLPDDGHRYEIVNGELIDMGNSGALHGYICSLLLAALIGYIVPKKLGVILDSSTAFKMKNGNKRSPDIGFFAKERLQEVFTPIGTPIGAESPAEIALSIVAELVCVRRKGYQQARSLRKAVGIEP